MKKVLSTALLASILLSFALMAAGEGLQHVSRSGGLTNSIKAGFLESQKGTGSYGTNTNKVVKQCWVRLREGDYDSGQRLSAVGKKSGGTRYIWTEKLEKFNNPFANCTTTYGWLYY